ncbi:MAG: galactose mutarotase [Clostridia bacterium]|nr:galactose mutarotase [Clostridia bacterium]MBQ8925868.1 galactose mutarotase [Clostridia bacterium]
MRVTTRTFPDPQGLCPVPVTEYTMQNDQGISVSCINYGCIITDVRMPDRNGAVESIVLRFPDLTGYIAHGSLYLGAMVGRTAGRIDDASFELDGAMYHLPKNDGTNSLHGNGEFSTALWEAEVFDLPDPTVCDHRQKVSVTFFYTSPAGSNGYPGEVHAEVTYLLNNNNEFHILYRATTTEDTLFDPTNHTYFNLSGDLKQDILSQVLIADVDRFVELRDDLIPTGTILPVDGTAFDFRLGEPFSQGRVSDHPQNVMVGHGYDHPFLFREAGNHSLRMTDAASGRALTLTTDAPAFVMYTCNEPEEGIELAGGPLVPFAGAALEAQGWPDAVHLPEAPSPVLKQGETFRRETVWSFALV